jgi:hypothetical protein
MTMSRKQRDTPVWVTVGRGPLILMPRPALMAWGGVEQPRGGRVIEARSRWRDPDAPATDYDRACDLQEPLGVLDVNGRAALVLGGEPLATTWLPRPDGGVLVRGAGGDNRPPPLPSSQTLASVRWERTGVRITSRESSWTLFEAACPGWEIDHSCAVSLHPGRYTVSTGAHTNTRYPLRLIRLSRDTAPRASGGSGGSGDPGGPGGPGEPGDPGDKAGAPG